MPLFRFSIFYVLILGAILVVNFAMWVDENFPGTFHSRTVVHIDLNSQVFEGVGLVTKVNENKLIILDQYDESEFGRGTYIRSLGGKCWIYASIDKPTVEVTIRSGSVIDGILLWEGGEKLSVCPLKLLNRSKLPAEIHYSAEVSKRIPVQINQIVSNPDAIRKEIQMRLGLLSKKRD